MLESLVEFAINLIEQLGYLGLFIGIFLEAIIPPIPSEVILPLAGFLVSKGEMQFFLAVLSATAASLVSAILIYGIGFFGGEKLIPNLVERYGKYVFISMKDYEKALNWTQKYGLKIAFFSRLIPGVRSIISLPLGMAKVSFTKFCLYTIGGALLWNSILIFIGLKLGDNWEIISPYLGYIEYLILLLVIIIIIRFVYKRIKSKGKGN
jgi:membrane protein DedA with SNARE-associated domain